MLALKTRFSSTPLLFALLWASYPLPSLGEERMGVLMEEVVVTAQKREQGLQDVGIAVTAFTGDQIRELGFINAIEVVAHTPGLQVSGGGGGTINTYSVRGVTQNDFSAAQESPVAAYIDEVYVSQNMVTNFSLFDIERVEILRGPQGTLFGRNATGGLVSYFTVTPSQETEAFAEATFGEDGRRRFEGAAGGALSDVVSARISAVYNESDGLIENAAGKDIRAQDDYAVRGQLLFEPSDTLSVLLKAQIADEDSTMGGYSHNVASAGVFVSDPTATDFFGYRDADGDPFSGAFDSPTKREAEVTDLTARIELALGDATLTSITNFQDIEHEYSEDSDVSPNSVYAYQGSDDVEQFSQELRLAWGGANYQGLVGLYYLNIDGDYGTGQSGDVFFGPGFVYTLASQQETETLSLFGQVDVDVAEHITLTLGARYNRDEKDFNFSELGVSVFDDSFTDNDIAAKVQLDFRPNDDWLYYASINRGIKSGGFNMPLAPPVDFATFEYDGEVLTSYEVGFKGELTDLTRLNASVFYYDYEDYQAYTFDGFVALLFNASAELSGAEIELVTAPLPGLELLLGVAYLDGEVEDVPLSISPTGTEDPVLAPELTFNALVRYQWEAMGGRIALQADYNWRSDHNFNLSFTPVIEEDSYGVLNASVSYTTEDDRWYGTVFVKNVTDEEYRRYGFDTSAFFNATEDVFGDERWIGMTVGYRM